jgi:hypothetical protein
MSDQRQLDLLSWQPDAPQGARAILSFPVTKRRPGKTAAAGTANADVASFPQDHRHDKVMDVATKLLAKTTVRAVEHYRFQVSDAMAVHLRSRRVPADQHREQIRRFWVAVDCEVARRLNGRQRPGGAA